jgi:hypothetical protein
VLFVSGSLSVRLRLCLICFGKEKKEKKRKGVCDRSQAMALVESKKKESSL